MTNDVEMKEGAGAIDISPHDLGGESADHPLQDENENTVMDFDQNNQDENEKAI